MSVIGTLIEALANVAGNLRDQAADIERLLYGHNGHNHLRLAIIEVSSPSFIAKGNIMTVTITDTQKVSLTAGYVNATGGTPVNPPVNDTFSWAIDTGGFASLDATSGPTVNLIGVAVGSGIVTLTDSAGLTAATLNYVVTADAAVGLVITVGTPVAK